MICGVNARHNIILEILIAAKRLLVFSFLTYEGCMCGLILVEASFSMNIYKCDNWYSPRGEDVLE